jgi:hypothetical protein
LSIAATGCSTVPGSDLPPPSTERLDLSVKVSPACETLDREVPHPAIKPGDDQDELVLAYIAALEVANATIGANRECKQFLRAQYAAAVRSQKK